MTQEIPTPENAPGLDVPAPGTAQLVAFLDAQEHPRLVRANRSGELAAADVHIARTLARLAGEADESVVMAVAQTVAAARQGSSCWQVDDATVLPRLIASPLVAPRDAAGDAGGAGRPLRLVDDLLYLDRFWRDERVVAGQILHRCATPARADLAALRHSLGQGRFADGPDRQRVATALAVLSRFTVIAGGPGTGKTTTVAKVIAALTEQPGPPPRIALAAPTGKAAARLQAAIAEQVEGLGLRQEVRASTIHRLLGYRPGSAPRHHQDNPLPHDVVIVDETSMVSLPLLARVLAAVREDARLILLGDPDQLASVEVGAVLADLVARPITAGSSAGATDQAACDPRWESVVAADLAADGEELRQDAARGVVRLTRGFRNNEHIAELARAIQDADPIRTLDLLRDPAVTAVQLLEIDDATDLATDHQLAQVRERVVQQAAEAVEAALIPDAHRALSILGRHQILTAHRTGPFGALRWAAAAGRAASQAAGGSGGNGGGSGGSRGGDPAWYIGRPIIIIRNDDDTGLSNGDVGIAVADAQAGLVVAFDVGRDVRFHPGRLPEHLPLQAITVHRAQGSQYDEVTVVLPEPGSALLTRELLYTAVTRARHGVTVLAHPEAVAQAVTRGASRASGLRRPQAWALQSD